MCPSVQTSRVMMSIGLVCPYTWHDFTHVTYVTDVIPSTARLQHIQTTELRKYVDAGPDSANRHKPCCDVDQEGCMGLVWVMGNAKKKAHSP